MVLVSALGLLASGGVGVAASLRAALAKLSVAHPGLSCERAEEAGLWRITYPAKYDISHEEQFVLVLNDFLDGLGKGGAPNEIDNLIVKYRTLVEARKLAHRSADK